jgi:UDP-N-acetylmuramoyl-tripeptide--D-alanyl-D-alanine ligase
MASPDIGLLINVGPAHIEMLGSLEAIAEAKCELVEGVKSDLVSNGEDALLQARLNALDIRHLRHHRYTQQLLQHLTPLANGCYTFEVDGVTFQSKLPGRHQVSNMLGVLEVARCLGLSTAEVATAFESFVPHSGRFEAIELGKGHCLINDAYNANPASMQASLTALFESAPPQEGMKRFLVIASMKELGTHSQPYHQALLEQIKAFPSEEIAGVLLIGEEFKPFTSDLRLFNAFPIHSLETVVEFEKLLKTLKWQKPLQWFLKGSRSHALETCIPILKTHIEMKGCPL